MRLTTILLNAGLAMAAPLETRQASTLSATDISVLQLALFLENLEFSLYSGGFANFTQEQYLADGFPEFFRENVGVIAEQESIHASTIAATLSAAGVTPVAPCQYVFPYTSPKTFVGVSDLVTTNGIGAYLGGALGLADNKPLLTIASSILTTEARHDAYLRAGSSQTPFPNPFDTSLPATYAYNIGLLFSRNCPMYLPIPVLPALTVAPQEYPASIADPIAKGGVLDVTWADTSVPVATGTALFLAFIQGNAAPVYVPVTQSSAKAGSAPVPEVADAFNGTFFAVLTTFSGAQNVTELTATGTLAGPVVFAVDSSSTV